MSGASVIAIPERILVVGASAAGLACVEALRRQGYTGRITVVGDEVHPPYDRPPLSKQILSGVWPPERSTLRSREVLAGLDAELVLGDAAVDLDVPGRAVRTTSGATHTAQVIIVATGARARSLPGSDGLERVHRLRTLDHALALRTDLLAAQRVVVVGEGVLGSEITATATQLGLHTTMTGPLTAPMALQVGPMVSALLAERHRAHGVNLRLGIGVAALEGENGRVRSVRLLDGQELAADVVVEAVGAVPNTDWLQDSGLPLENGLVCDSRCRAAEGIYAVGDVARFRHEQLGRLVRLENRTNATEQATAVARVVLGHDEPYLPVPYFWSDQFDVKIQVYGMIAADAEAEVVEGSVSAGRFVVRYHIDGRVAGVLGWNMPKQARLRRQEIVDALNQSPTRSRSEEVSR
ncbi:FAD-dependent oxidoreductase [Kineosporia mesophila]|uniref:FAD-dependent oxidoreductase n=1 Tax=Kineosporia mesophila TaxID=566012 RepID=A0ABP6ZM63_9ACTN|nr:FAD-dependent oxidoreductase [Kineosporia mesophila]MCD5354488.1 FAD-dependent oxidoreductase [Kineosporia mesophila]